MGLRFVGTAIVLVAFPSPLQAERGDGLLQQWLKFQPQNRSVRARVVSTISTLNFLSNNGSFSACAHCEIRPFQILVNFEEAVKQELGQEPSEVSNVPTGCS
eukprot:1453022-Amphidinium_carterae.1